MDSSREQHSLPVTSHLDTLLTHLSDIAICNIFSIFSWMLTRRQIWYRHLYWSTDDPYRFRDQSVKDQGHGDHQHTVI